MAALLRQNDIATSFDVIMTLLLRHVPAGKWTCTYALSKSWNNVNIYKENTVSMVYIYTVKTVCNDHLYYKLYYLWLIQ